MAKYDTHSTDFWRKFYSVDAFAYAYNNLTIAITLSALVMLIGQILFPINIVYGLLKNRTGR